MNYFLTTFRFSLQQRLSSFKNWIVLLLLPLLVFSANLMLPTWHTEATVSVGVVLPESGGEEMWQILQSRNDDVISFILTDADTLDRNIAAGRWDCGIVLSENFQKKISQLDTDRIFTLRIGPGSTVYPLVKETISACVAQLIGPDIALDYLLDSGITEDQAKLEQALTDPDRVLVTMSTLDGEPVRVPDLTLRGTKDFLRWLLCVSILVRMLFGAADLNKWIHSPGMRRTQPLRAPLVSMAARASADALLLFLSASAALLLLGDGFGSITAALGYILLWLAISLVLAQFPRTTPLLHLCIPFAVVISLLMSSVLMDISHVFPQLSGISRLLPVTIFLRICNGEVKDLTFLLAGSAILLILAWIVSLCKRKI